MKKYRKADDDKGAALAGTLNGMMRENAHSNIDATETYLDYVKTWTVENDRGKLIHVTNDAYRFFVRLKRQHMNCCRTEQTSKEQSVKLWETQL